MANLQLYSLLYAVVNGALLTEEANLSVQRTSGSNPVKTVAKGYAGEAPGASMVQIEVTNAIPASDFEIYTGPYISQLQVVEMGIVGPSGKMLKAKGFIVEDSFKHAVDTESTFSFTFRGQFADWQ
jgi:hypothetical protein